MAFWDGLLGPDVGLYDELLTEKQRNAINDPFSSRSLAAMSKAFADAARPSLTPGPGLGAALGNAAYMMSAGRDEAAQTLLKAGLTAQQIETLRRQAALQNKLVPLYERVLGNMGVGGAGGTTPGVSPSAVSPAPAVPRPAPASYAPPVPSPPAPPGSTGGTEDFLAPSFSSYPKTAGLLPPPDEYIPQQGQGGIFDVLNAAYSGGTGTPGLPFRDGAGTGEPAPLRLASASGSPSSALNDIPGGVPFSTQARPNAPPIKWRYDNPVIDPNDPASQGPGSPVKAGNPLTSVADLADAVNRGDVVIPPARAIDPALVRMAQARTGGAPAALPAVPGAPNPQADISTPIPGLGISPKELMAIDALSEMAKMGTPFKGLLESYYKTPGYQEQSAAAAARGRIGEEEPMQRRLKYLDLMIDMRKNGVIYDPQTNTVSTDPTYDALMNRREEDKKAIELDYNKKLKTFEEGITIEKEKRGIVTAPVLQPDGTFSEETMTGAERDRRLREQSMRPSEVRPGDIVPKPEAKPEAGYTLKRGPGGELAAAPITGSKAADEAAAAARAKEIADRQLQVSRDVVVRSVDRIGENMNKAILPTVGTFGPLVSRFGGTAASNIADDLKTIEARSSLDAINALRQQGGTLGAITEGEHALLAAAIVNLKQSQTEEQFRENLAIVKQHYIDAVHGPGAYNKYLSDLAVQKRPAGVSPSSEAAQARTRAADAIARGAPRDAVIKRLQDAGIDTGGL